MPRADRVPFLLVRPLVAVRAVLNERRSVALIVDSGAQRSLISRRVAVSLGFDLARPLQLQTLAGVGQSPPVPIVRLDRLRVGGSTVSRLAVPVHELPSVMRADGLLGLDFLRRFRVTLDFDSGVLILREPATRRGTG